MKKIKYLLFIIPVLLIVASCAKSKLHVEKTIELSVDTNVVPEFTASFGEGSYNESTKTYTHKIPYIKDLTIYLSYENLKTEQVVIKTEEMKEDLIKKSVSFGASLDCDISITVKGVSDLSSVNLNMPSALNVTKSKKSLSFKLPSREETFTGKLEIENYQDIDLEFTPDNLKTGYYETDYMAVPNDKIYIKLVNECRVEIYDAETSTLIQEANNWQYGANQTSNYVLLPSDKEYFVIYSGNVKKLSQGENYVVNGKFNGNGSYSYYNLDYTYYSNMGFNPSIYFYNKKDHLFVDNLTTNDYIDDFGVLYTLDQTNYYLSDASKCIDTSNNTNKYDNYFRIIENVEPKIRITSFNLDIRSIYDDSTIDFTNMSYPGSIIGMLKENQIASIIDDNGVVNASAKVYPSGDINIKIYNKENNDLLYTVNNTIGFPSRLIEGYNTISLNYEGRNIEAGYIFYKDDILSYDKTEKKYTYKDQYIAVDTSLVRLYVKNLYNFSVYDEDGEEVVAKTQGISTYYKLSAGKQYKILEKYSEEGRKIYFTPTEDEISSGAIYINYDIEYKELNLPEDVVVVSSDNQTVIKKENGKTYYGNVDNQNYYYLTFYYKSNPSNYKMMSIYDGTINIKEYSIINAPNIGYEKYDNFLSSYDEDTRTLKTLAINEDYGVLFYYDENHERYFEVQLTDNVYQYQLDYKVINLPTDTQYQITAAYKNYYIWERIGNKNIITRIDNAASAFSFRVLYKNESRYATISGFDSLTEDYFVEYSITLSEDISVSINNADICYKYDSTTRLLTVLCPKTYNQITLRYTKDSTTTNKIITFVEGQTSYDVTL